MNVDQMIHYQNTGEIPEGLHPSETQVHRKIRL
jgi:hypothetical protein